MDALYHFVLALSGGYILVKGLGMRYKISLLILTALVSMSLDLDHFLRIFGINKDISFHSLYIVLIPLIVYLILRKERIQTDLGNYLLILSIMMYGHLAMDMVEGLYGIPLFYPLTDRLFLIPGKWEVFVFGDRTKPLITTEGIGLSLYFGLIFLLIALNPIFSGDALKRRDTKTGSSSLRTRSSLRANGWSE